MESDWSAGSCAEGPQVITADIPQEPTSDECNAHASVLGGFACWYPSMGGYVGKCVIIPDSESDCFEAYIWHDGEFPFCGSEKNPVRIHHCDASQFIEFGKLVMALQTIKGVRNGD